MACGSRARESSTRKCHQILVSCPVNTGQNLTHTSKQRCPSFGAANKMHGSFALLLMYKSKLCREVRLKTAKGLVPRRELISRIAGAHLPRRAPVPSISLALGRIHEHLLRMNVSVRGNRRETTSRCRPAALCRICRTTANASRLSPESRLRSMLCKRLVYGIAVTGCLFSFAMGYKRFFSEEKWPERATLGWFAGDRLRITLPCTLISHECV